MAEYMPPSSAGALLTGDAQQQKLTAEEEQYLILDEHAARFARAKGRLTAIETMLYNGQPMRQLVATVGLPARTRIAAYPVEVVSDEDDDYSEECA